MVWRRPIRLLMVLVLAAGCAFAGQRGGRRGGAGPAFRPPPRQALGSSLQRFRKLTPAQQEKRLKQDPAFRQLPPERQQQLLDTLHRLNSLPPRQQQQLLNRMHNFGEMTPEQRRGVEGLYQDWKTLSPQRRQALNRAYANLRILPPQQQQRRLNNPNFQSRFSPQERNLLQRALDLNLPNGPGGAPPL